MTTYPGQAEPGWFYACRSCGFLVDYDCGCDDPQPGKRDWIGFDTLEQAKAAVGMMRASGALPTPAETGGDE